jgi:hypothetical protein
LHEIFHFLIYRNIRLIRGDKRGEDSLLSDRQAQDRRRLHWPVLTGRAEGRNNDINSTHRAEIMDGSDHRGFPAWFSSSSSAMACGSFLLDSP